MGCILLKVYSFRAIPFVSKVRTDSINIALSLKKKFNLIDFLSFINLLFNFHRGFEK